jgi:hypothetical protein
MGSNTPITHGSSFIQFVISRRMGTSIIKPPAGLYD